MVLYLWRYVPTNNYITQEPYYVSDKAIDDFNYLRWSENYYKPGEFKLKINATPAMLEYFKSNDNLIISRNDTNHAMIVETVNLKTNAKSGDTLEITGSSLESALNQRAIEQTYTLSGKADDLIYHFIKENAGNYWYYNTDAQHLPLYKMRYINMLGIDDHTALGGGDAEVQPFGVRLGVFVSAVCQAFGFGFKILFEDGRMKYSCYKGLDRSINQSDRNCVIFSDDYANLGNTDFLIDNRTYFNRITVSGEGEGKDRVTASTGMSLKLGGMALREKFLDKKSISSNSDGATNYNRLLGSIANAELDASKKSFNFTGNVLPGGQFEYRKHYDLGDTVTVRNGYGITGSAIVSEVVETVDATGYRVIPTFTEWRIDENDGTD